MQVNMRREQRRHNHGTYSLLWQENGLSNSVPVQGIDISDSGAAFGCSRDLPLGSIVFIAAQDNHLIGYCTVRHCTLNGTGYIVGLEFDDNTRKTVTHPASISTDYYEFLQISPKAEFATIHRIYRFLASRFHPDNPSSGDPEKFIMLNRAYEVLSDPERRAEYDAGREREEVKPIPIFESSEFVNGIEGETNRRLGVLSLLYNKRRTSCDNPRVSLMDLEKWMAFPRDYLNFTTWYLRSKKYITVEDNSDFALTALGVDYVEANSTKNPVLRRLLTAGAWTATGPRTASSSAPDSPGQPFEPGPHEAPTAELEDPEEEEPAVPGA